MKTKQSGVSAGISRNLINSKVAKKLLLVLLASTSIAYAANVGCKDGVRAILKTNPDPQTLTLKFSADQEGKAKQCKAGIMNNKRVKIKQVNMQKDSNPDAKDTFEITTP